MRTCKWCGKQFDYDPSSRGSHSTAYCCGRCYNAAMNEEQKQRQINDEKADKFRKKHPLIAFFITIVMLGGFAIIMIGDFLNYRGKNEQKTIETEREAIVTQPSVGIESIEPIVQVVNQSELSDISEEINDDWLPEPLEITEDQSEWIDADEIMEYEDVEEEVVRPDYSSQKVYDIVDEMPTFSNGDHELLKYIADNLEYPQEAIDADVQGTVFVKIIVEPDGSVSNAKIIRGIGSGCDEEAVRVVESLPNWEPGRRKGEAVRVYMSIPVSFKL